MKHSNKKKQPVQSRKTYTGELPPRSVPKELTDLNHEQWSNRVAQELVSNLNRYVLEEQKRDLARQQKVKK